jgi:hypothetical protein
MNGAGRKRFEPPSSYATPNVPTTDCLSEISIGARVAFLSVTYIQCRREVEMSPGAQSRNDTLADPPRAKRPMSSPSIIGEAFDSQSRP